MTAHPYNNVPLVLISGVGRSGTTAVRESLGLHPDIDSTQRENNIIYDVLDAAYRNCTAASRRYAMRVDDAAYDAAFRELLLSLLWPRPRAITPARVLAFSDLTPERADYLVRLFPGVKIVYVVRNGIEVVASRMRYEGFKAQPFEQQARVWSLALEIARWGERREDFLLVRHEQLIAREGPEHQTRRVCAFLGLAYAPACAANLRGKTYHPTPEVSGAAPVRPLQSRCERWRDWTGEQVRTFAERCTGAMEYFGYECPWAAESQAAAVEPKGVVEPAGDAVV